MPKIHRYDLVTARVGSIVDAQWNNQYWTFEKKENGWHLAGEPIELITLELRLRKQAYYRRKKAATKTGIITEILPRT